MPGTKDGEAAHPQHASQEAKGGEHAETASPDLEHLFSENGEHHLVGKPQQLGRQTIQVNAVRPDRDHLEIRFPRVQGYRVESPEEPLTAQFNQDPVLVTGPDIMKIFPYSS